LILIPKGGGAEYVGGNCRPVALSNFRFNIITKMLAGRISVTA